MTKYQALQSFWESFGIPAYDEGTVSDDAVMPYITYESGSDDLGVFLGLSASVWYYSTTWKDITSKVMEIERRLKRGGVQIRYEGGSLWIAKGSPFAQRISDLSTSGQRTKDSSSDMVRRYVLNIQAEYFD